ncbi:MAG: plasmid pRiA4b ORF-3 family protein, partial [Acidobacteria bacterium]|nr:plasmid pRiA4b ORF-3 family protein [Acidobacteriota bacterium]
MRLRAPQLPGGGEAPGTFTSRPTTRLVYHIKVTLHGVRPPVWRRFLIEPHVSLHRLHRVLQLVMGWENCHLYELTIQGARYGLPDP